MPRRRIPNVTKSRDDLLRDILACPAPQILKQDRLTEFLPHLVKQRRLGASWSDLTAAICDRHCRYSIHEVKSFVEPRVEESGYDPDMEIAKQSSSSAVSPSISGSAQRARKPAPAQLG